MGATQQTYQVICGPQQVEALKTLLHEAGQVRLPASGGKLSQQQLREYSDSATQASGAPTATQPAGSVADAAATPAPIAREVSIGRGDLITVTFRIEDSRRILNMVMRVTKSSTPS